MSTKSAKKRNSETKNQSESETKNQSDSETETETKTKNDSEHSASIASQDDDNNEQSAETAEPMTTRNKAAKTTRAPCTPEGKAVKTAGTPSKSAKATITPFTPVNNASPSSPLAAYSKNHDGDGEFSPDKYPQLVQPRILQELIPSRDWKDFCRVQGIAAVAKKAVDACRYLECQLESNDSVRQITTLEDLRESSDRIGTEFGRFLMKSLHVGNAIWIHDGAANIDADQFGHMIGRLLQAFINRERMDFSTLPELQIVTINGVRPASPPPPIQLSSATSSSPRAMVELSPLPTPNTAVGCSPSGGSSSRKSTQRSDSTLFTSRKVPRVSKASVRDMSDVEIRHRLEKMQHDPKFVKYDEFGYMRVTNVVNNPVVTEAFRYITVPELIKLLLARPWEAIAARAFPFRIPNSHAQTSATIESIRGTVKDSVQDFFQLVARWERSFRIHLPSMARMKEVFPNEVDREWVVDYVNKRTARGQDLLHNRKKWDGYINHLPKALQELVKNDPGCMAVPHKVIDWMPTRERLLYDMAIRAAQHPTRFYSVFNPATHCFFRKHLQYAFPATREKPRYITPTYEDDLLFSKAICEKYPIQEWKDEAEAEWAYYQQQLDVPFDEPPVPRVRFPRQAEFAKYPASTFTNTRYAYCANGVFIDDPLGEDGNPVGVEAWNNQNQWVEQSVVSHTIKIYNRDDPDSDVWPLRSE